nr:protein transport protein SEC31-like [Aegilops tauschii subsp. strangulata]
MSSTAPAAVAAAAVGPVLAPMSTFLASRPLAAAYGALPPPGSPIGSNPYGASPGDPASTAAAIVAPPSYGVAAPPPYGATSSMPYGVAAPLSYGPNPYGASLVAPGAPPPPSSSWQAVSYGAPPPHQPYAAPPRHPYGPPPSQLAYSSPPPQPYAPHGGTASSPRQPYPGGAAASLQPSYGVAPTPQQQPHGGAAVSPYGAHAAPNYGALATGPPGFYAPYSVPAAHAEMAPSMGLYAPPPHAHADQAAVPSPFYFSHLLPVKLAPDNYLSWRAQVLPLLRSRYLEGYVDGSIPCPPPHHPAYHTWVAQDQAILSAIQSSLTPSVSSLVIFAATSREAWAALHTSFASQSQARAHSIRTELGKTKLGDLSITDYFNKTTGLADTLASVGQQLQDEEFTTYVLNGLDDDYDNLIENVHGRDDPLPPREL